MQETGLVHSFKRSPDLPLQRKSLEELSKQGQGLVTLPSSLFKSLVNLIPLKASSIPTLIELNPIIVNSGNSFIAEQALRYQHLSGS